MSSAVQTVVALALNGGAPKSNEAAHVAKGLNLQQRETALYRALLHATDRPLGSAAPFDYDTLAAALRGLSAEQLMAAARALLPAERRLIVLQEAAPNVKGAALITVEGELFTPTRELP